MHSVQDLFDLDEAVAWIRTNGFRCVALELPVYLLKYAVQLTRFLNTNVGSPVEFYTVALNCCSVDYVSPRHLNGLVDAVIRFGQCCLTSLPKGIVEYPVLFMFENHFPEQQANDFIADYLKSELKKDGNSLVIADTNCLVPLLALRSLANVSLAKFIRFTDKWTVTDKLKEHFIDLQAANQMTRFYNYLLDKDLSGYKRLYFVGERIPNSLKVLSLLEVVHVNPNDRTATRIATSKELMKRCSLIERVKKLTRFGVVFSHSYPDVSPLIDEIQKLADRKKKQINFITLVQTTDQFKLGNFAALESLVLVNSCYCSQLIDTISLHIPLISYSEFKIACGQRLSYGQVNWNEDIEERLDELMPDEPSNQLLLDDRNTALVENYLKQDRWFGLQVNAGQDEIGELRQGLKGIAMAYQDGDVQK